MISISYCLTAPQMCYLARHTGHERLYGFGFETSGQTPWENVERELENAGIIALHGNRIAIDRTARFLLKQLALCRGYAAWMEGERLQIHFCPKVICTVTRDGSRKNAYVLTPVEDAERLAQWLTAFEPAAEREALSFAFHRMGQEGPRTVCILREHEELRNAFSNFLEEVQHG